MTFPVRVGIIISRLGFECCSDWLHFLDSPLIKSWKFWPIWLVSEFHQSRKTEGREYLHWISGRCENQCCWKKGIKDHEKRGNAQNTDKWQSDNRENVKHKKRNQSFFQSLFDRSSNFPANATWRSKKKSILIKDFLHFTLMQNDAQPSIFPAARGKHKLIHLDDHKKQEPSISQQMNGLLLGWKHNKSGALMVCSCIRACI